MGRRRKDSDPNKKYRTFDVTFKDEEKVFLESILKFDTAHEIKVSKFILDIFSTIKYYYEHNPKIVSTFFGVLFYQKYFGHIDKKRELDDSD